MSQGFDPSVFAPLAPQQQQPIKSADETSKLDRELRRVSRGITINRWVGLVICLTASIITVFILLISTTLNADRKIFFAGVLFVCSFGIQIVLCLVRDDPVTVIFLTLISSNVSMITLGLAIWYA